MPRKQKRPRFQENNEGKMKMRANQTKKLEMHLQKATRVVDHIEMWKTKRENVK